MTNKEAWEWMNRHLLPFYAGQPPEEAIWRAMDALLYVEAVEPLTNCNDCGGKYGCSHRPGWGEMVRINCFEWTPEAPEGGRTNGK